MINDIYNIIFLGPQISIKISPIAVAVGPVQIRWYGVTLAIGFLLAFLYMYIRAKDFNLDKEKLTDITIISAVFGIVGARLYYVLFYPGDFYKINPSKIFNIYEGGMAIYGGIIGGALGSVVGAKIKGVKILSFLDLASLGLLIGQTIGRWGNFFNQEAFGSKTNMPWAMASEATHNEFVHPCFLYESLWCLVGFIILHIITRKKKLEEGSCLVFYAFWYSSGRFLIEGLRTDSLIFLNLKVSQIISLIFIFGSVIFIFLKEKSKKAKKVKKSKKSKKSKR